MPELPEAETIIRGIRPHAAGRRISRVEVLRPDLLREEPGPFRSKLEGTGIPHVHRRGKNLILGLDEGGVLFVNLGMTGRLLAVEDGAPDPGSHTGVRIHLELGGRLVYDDVRRFGVLEALSPADWTERDQALGPEPLGPSWTGARLAGDLARSRSPIRSWLLDQRRVAGVGNIYANEALHRARIHPARPAGSLGPDEVRRLHRSVRAVLREAIRSRGTTLRDYRDARGDMGSYGASLRVYGRSGEPCPRCPAPVERCVIANRSAFFCPRCQPPPPASGRGDVK